MELVYENYSVNLTLYAKEQHSLIILGYQKNENKVNFHVVDVKGNLIKIGEVLGGNGYDLLYELDVDNDVHTFPNHVKTWDDVIVNMLNHLVCHCLYVIDSFSLLYGTGLDVVLIKPLNRIADILGQYHFIHVDGGERVWITKQSGSWRRLEPKSVNEYSLK